MSAPPRRADRMMEHSVGRPVVAGTIIGDLHEEHAAMRRRRGDRIAALWYWQQALRLSATYRFGRSGARVGREVQRSRWGADLILDFRYAARGIRRNPVSSVIIITTLALAIGVNATMFGIIDRLLLSAPPFIVDPANVVRLNLEMDGFNGERFVMQATSYPVFEDLRDGTTAFAGWAAAAGREAALGVGEDALGVAASAVSGNYFEVLGVQPTLGRFLNEADDRPPAGNTALVLSHGMWQRRFGGDRAVLGTEVLVDGAAYAVVGVAPAGFSGDGLAPVDVWLPIHAAFAGEDASWQSDRRRRLVTVVGRRAPGVAHATAQQEADRALAAGAATSSATPRAVLGPLTPGRGPQGTSMQARISLWLGGVTLVVFAVAAANVANLLLLRAQQRRRELAVRQALGMGRGRMLRQLLTETSLLAALAAAAAFLVAAWASDLLHTWLLPGMLPPATPVGPGGIATIGLAALAAAVFAAILPALGTTTSVPVAAAAREEAGARSRLRGALLLAQTSLSAVLLVGAGLFVTSLRNVQAQDLGLHLDGVLLAQIEFAGELGVPDRDAVYRQTLARVRSVPGVELAVAAQTVPFGPYTTLPIGFPGKDFRALFGNRQVPYFHAVEAPFFELMGIDIVEGRALLPSDDAAAPPAVVISDSLARLVWPGESAVGKCMRAGMILPPTPESFLDGAGEDVPCYEVVGVSADVVERSLLPEARLTLQWYTTFEQMPPLPAMMADGGQIQALLIRAPRDPGAVTAAVQRAMQGASDHIAYVNVRPYRDLIDPGARSWQLGATLFTAFGSLALAIAAVGIYGVFAFTVAQRRREMGVRMALGAGPGDLARLVLGSSLRSVGYGIALGGGIGLWAARHLEDLLFETSAFNLPVVAGVAALLAGVALLASIVPTMRAVRTDPKVTLSQG